MKNIILFAFILPAVATFARAQSAVPSEEGLFLEMQKLGLGSLNELEEKKKFFELIKIEKNKVRDYTLDGVADDALRYFRAGDYDAAKELSAKILAINPLHERALSIFDATNQIGSSAVPGRLGTAKEVIEARYRRALKAYSDGYIEEAYKRMGEVVQLSPSNRKAQNWYRKMKDGLYDYYYEKGMDYYGKNNLPDAVDTLYKALMMATARNSDKKADVQRAIMKIQDEINQQKADKKIEEATEAYYKGKYIESHDKIVRAIEIQPGDVKARELLKDVNREIADNFKKDGMTYYNKHDMSSAINSWEAGKKYALNIEYFNKLIATAKQVQINDAKGKKRKEAERAKRQKEEAERKKKEEEEKKKKEAEAQREGISLDELESGKKIISEDSRLQAEKLYQQGVVEFQNSHYEEAKKLWTAAARYDPENDDIKKGLEKIDSILGQ